MGRLTDNMLAVLGIKPSDRVVLAPKDTSPGSSIVTSVPAAVTGAVQSVSQDNITESSQPCTDAPKKTHALDTRAVQTSSAQQTSDLQREAVQSSAIQMNAEGQAQEEFKDCASCRYIGTATLTCAAAFVGKMGMSKGPKFYSGWRLNFFRVQTGLASTTLLLTAACRFFNLGMFSHENQDKGFQELFVKDCLSLCDQLRITPPAYLMEMEENLKAPPENKDSDS